jgi:hypothetical protein
MSLCAIAALAGAQTRSPAATDETVAALILIACAALSGKFFVQLTRKTNVSPMGAVLVAAALLFEPGIAMVLIAAGVGAAQVLTRRSFAESAFNVSQSVLCAGAGSFIIRLPDSFAPGRDRLLDTVLAVGLAAIVMHVLNTWFVSTAGALQTETPVLVSWRASLWLDFPEEMVLAAVGVAGALLIEQSAWLSILMIASVVLSGLYLRHRFGMASSLIERQLP